MNALTPTAAPNGPLLSFIERASRDDAFSMDKFEALLRMQRDEQDRQAEREFNQAMADAQGEMEPVRKGATNLHTRSKYARFEDIDQMLKPVYTRHGFSVRFRTEDPSQPGWVKVVCVVAHRAGHIETFPLQAPLDSAGSGGKTNKTDVQAIGSTTSYLKRYLLTLAWNVSLAGDDDDGEGSRNSPSPPARPARPAYEPTSMRDMRPKTSPERPAPSRAELDKALDGDQIPDFDASAQPEVDKAAEGVMALEARVRACTTEDQLHSLTGDAEVAKKRAWLAKHRPELDVLLADALGQRYNELVAARQEAAEPEPEMPLP